MIARIFHEASSGTFTSFFIGEPFTLLDTVDTDGKPGSELVLGLDRTVKIIRDASNTTRSYRFDSPYIYLGAAQLDGIAGLELRFDSGGRIRVLNDRLQRLT